MEAPVVENSGPAALRPDSPRAAGPPAGAEPDWLRETVRRFQAGADRDGAFHLLFRTYFPAVRRFFARKGLPPEDCLDLTQETFLRIYTGLESFRGEARFDTWLYRIASTTYLKHLRARHTVKRSGQEVSSEELEEGGMDPFAAPPGQLREVLSRERRQALSEAVRGLPDQMRRSLLLYVEQGLKYREIAVVMRLSIQTVKAHLFQARKRLKESLGEDFLRDLEP